MAYTCPKWPRGLGFSALKRSRPPFITIGPWPIYKTAQLSRGGVDELKHEGKVQMGNDSSSVPKAL